MSNPQGLVKTRTESEINKLHQFMVYAGMLALKYNSEDRNLIQTIGTYLDFFNWLHCEPTPKLDKFFDISSKLFPLGKDTLPELGHKKEFPGD